MSELKAICLDKIESMHRWCEGAKMTCDDTDHPLWNFAAEIQDELQLWEVELTDCTES